MRISDKCEHSLPLCQEWRYVSLLSKDDVLNYFIFQINTSIERGLLFAEIMERIYHCQRTVGWSIIVLFHIDLNTINTYIYVHISISIYIKFIIFFSENHIVNSKIISLYQLFSKFMHCLLIPDFESDFESWLGAHGWLPAVFEGWCGAWGLDRSCSMKKRWAPAQASSWLRVQIRFQSHIRIIIKFSYSTDYSFILFVFTIQIFQYLLLKRLPWPWLYLIGTFAMQCLIIYRQFSFVPCIVSQWHISVYCIYLKNILSDYYSFQYDLYFQIRIYKTSNFSYSIFYGFIQALGVLFLFLRMLLLSLVCIVFNM